jgi:hypothetical protein
VVIASSHPSRPGSAAGCRSPLRSSFDRFTRWLGAFLLGLAPALISAHDLERTAVRISFAADRSFVIEVENDPAWLLLRLEPFAGRAVPAHPTPAERDRRLSELTTVFADRTVLFVDGHEVRPESIEYVAPPASPADPPQRAIFRLRGHLPGDARTARWFYGIVIDPYPLTLRLADGRTVSRVVAGDAWSDVVDLPSGGRATRFDITALVAVAALLVTARWWAPRSTERLRRALRPAVSDARYGRSA